MLLFAAALVAATAAFAATPPRAVRIGFNGPELDACPSQGAVSGLNPRGDNFLTVRRGPGADAGAAGRLGGGHLVNICETSADGQWLGIVYTRSPALDRDCGTGAPVPRVRAYRGPCLSGWVAARYVRVVAG
ncbi:MAG TPA: hypothetical protein VLK25_05840 [Allosphingosinicella sp.]|nr:hypothetical protein [Allosphingosinicella sp.]